MAQRDERLVRYLLDNQPLENLSVAAAQLGISCWLVGGALRDVLLGRSVTDVDLATDYDPTALAKYWAEQQGGHWFWLDQERSQSRVLLRYGKLEFCLDFAPLRAATLEEDLALRDYTINALALPLVSPLAEQRLIDPLDGFGDLSMRRLHHCSERSLADDPLRIMKGIRHAVTLDLQICPETRQQMCAQANGLDSSAAERKRNELGRILASDQVEEGITLLVDCGLLSVLFNTQDKDFSLARLLPEFSELKTVLDNWRDDATLAGLLNESFEETMSRRDIYLLALLLRHYACPHLNDLLHDRLRLSRRSVAVIEDLVAGGTDSLAAYVDLPDNSRARALWLESLGRTAVDQLLFFAALINSEPLTLDAIRQLLEDYFAAVSFGRIPDLLSGQELKQLLPDLGDKRIGQLQKQVKELEIAGEIATVKEAREYLMAEFSIDNP